MAERNEVPRDFVVDTGVGLAEIRDYLRFRMRATAQDFARNFKLTPEQMEVVLDRWVQENRLQKSVISNCCGSGCDVCDTSVSEYYEWKDQ